jgi:hypothetical protein
MGGGSPPTSHDDLLVAAAATAAVAGAGAAGAGAAGAGAGAGAGAAPLSLSCRRRGWKQKENLPTSRRDSLVVVNTGVVSYMNYKV